MVPIAEATKIVRADIVKYQGQRPPTVHGVVSRDNKNLTIHSMFRPNINQICSHKRGAETKELLRCSLVRVERMLLATVSFVVRDNLN